MTVVTVAGMVRRVTVDLQDPLWAGSRDLKGHQVYEACQDPREGMALMEFQDHGVLKVHLGVQDSLVTPEEKDFQERKEIREMRGFQAKKDPKDHRVCLVSVVYQDFRAQRETNVSPFLEKTDVMEHLDEMGFQVPVAQWVPKVLGVFLVTV